MKGKNKNSEIQEAVRILRSGGVVVFPTETSYGLGCDATNPSAVKRIFQIKGRDANKGMPLIVDSLLTAKRWVFFSLAEEKLCKKFWPGPLTIIVKPKKGIAGECLQKGTVAMRVSSHKIARALAQGLGKPLVATSANLSGQSPCFRVRDAKNIKADFFVSGGTLRPRKASTIARVEKNEIKIVRQGPVRL